MNLGFLNGNCECPTEESSGYEQWVRVYFIESSWIFDSISKDIVEVFLYTSTTKELWDELEERFDSETILDLSHIKCRDRD